MDYLPLVALALAIVLLIVQLSRPLRCDVDGAASLRPGRWLLSTGAVVLLVCGSVQAIQAGVDELEARRLLDSGRRATATVVEPFGSPTLGAAVISSGGCDRANVEFQADGERRAGSIEVHAATENLVFPVAFDPSVEAGRQPLVATEGRCRRVLAAPETGLAALLLGCLHLTLRRATLPARRRESVP